MRRLAPKGEWGGKTKICGGSIHSMPHQKGQKNQEKKICRPQHKVQSFLAPPEMRTNLGEPF